MKKTMFLLAVITISVYSCKKDNPTPNPEPIPEPCYVQENIQTIYGTWILENGVIVNSAGDEILGMIPYVGEELTISATNCFSNQRGGIQFSTACNDLSLDNRQYSIVELNDSTLTLEEINYPTTLYKKLYYTK